MSRSATAELDAELDASEADYFGAILALQSASQQSSALPEPLLELIEAVKTTIQSEGILCPWAKPELMTAPELAAFGTAQDLTVFRRHDDGAQDVVAFNQESAVGLVNLMLGGKQVKTARAPSRVENQIVHGLIGLLSANFKAVEAPQTMIVWQDFVGAKLAFNETAGGSFLVLMINRRVENVPIHQPLKPDAHRQNYVRQAVGNSVLNVDYVLDGGAVSLSLLANLVPGSVLPLLSSNDDPMHARANGKTVFSGVLNLTVDRMAMKISRVLNGGGHE